MNDDWERVWREVVSRMSSISHVGYWNQRADDYDDFIRTSEFAYGEAMAEVLAQAGMIGSGSHVLEIASGVGAVTLPLASRCAGVVAVEPADRMADRLADNARARDLGNIEIRRQTLEDAMGGIPANSFDFTLMCHASWQFPDIMNVVRFMDAASRKGACLADTAGLDDQAHGEMYKALGIEADCTDRFPCLFNLLYSWGYRPNVRMLDYTMRRSVDSALSMWQLLLGKYRTPTAEDLVLINDHVARRARNGLYEAPSVMAVMWWGKRPGTM